jgi:hypothetical protein
LRKWLLWGALAATLGSAILAPSEESPRRDVRAGSRVPAAGAAPTVRAERPAAEPSVLVRPARESDSGMVVNLFEPRLPPAPPAAAVKPVAPPLPFAYMGSLEDGGKLKVFLVQGEKVFEAAPGSEFAPNYRLDTVGAEGLTITYLPLNTQQSLQTGGAK